MTWAMAHRTPGLAFHDMTDVFKVMKENNRQPRILHPVKTFVKSEGKIKIPGTNKSWEDPSAGDPSVGCSAGRGPTAPDGNWVRTKGQRAPGTVSMGVNTQDFFKISFKK